MRVHSKLFAGILCIGLLAVGCKKSETAEPAPAQTAPASTNSATPAAAPSAAPASAATASSDAGALEVNSKMAAADWALKQDEIKNDANGLWAIEAKTSSTYNDAKGTESFSANQTTGAPNVDGYGDNGNAWAPKTQDAGIEWLDLKYPKAVHATAIRVRESCGSGAVIKVELFDEQGTAHTAWAGNDPTTELNYLVVKLPKTAYKTDHLKITLATNTVPGWDEIDAVQLVGTEN